MILNENEVTVNTTERKLLWGIYQTLQEIKGLLLVPVTAEQTAKEEEPKLSLEGLKRNELLGLVKNLPDNVRPGRYQRWTNQEIIDFLEKEGGV